MATQQVVPVSCSNCKAQFTAPVQSIIDGQDLAQKSALLQGVLNVVQCPQCGFASMLNVPILYYDLEKELALVFAPGGLEASPAEQEKMIGNLTNTVVNRLPAEQRKFYLLNPKQFLTLESLVKAVLEADGITEEMIEAQSAKVKLIEEFLNVTDEAVLKEKVKAHDAELDRQFFEILTASMQEAQLTGNQAGAQALLALRTLLAQWSTQGQQAVDEIDAELGLILIQSQEELLEKLRAAENDEEFEALVAAGHPMIDYGFFQSLTAQIDKAQQAKDTGTAKVLRDLRTKILDTKERHEEKTRAAIQKSAELLKEILQSSQPEKTLMNKLDEINEAFFVVLSANIEEANRQNQKEAAQAMTSLGNAVMTMLQERHSKSAKADETAADTPQILVAR